MNLHRQEQVYYTLPHLTASTPAGRVEVPVTGWEASFDAGESWHAAQAHPNLPAAPCWLVRGPNHPGIGDTSPASGVLISRTTAPLIRLKDTPETVIERAEQITLR